MGESEGPRPDPAFPARRAIAVDGLAGAGKSTVSRRVARRLGWAYLDTGACYRALTVAALRAGAVQVGATEPGRGLAAVAATALTDLDMSTDPDIDRVHLAGDDITDEIRSRAVTGTVSAVAADPELRGAAVRWQRSRVARAAGCVVEGRDIGTVVLPDAPLKVWLTASPARRADRRAGDDGGAADDTRRALDRRDELDSGRTADPAKPATDAVVIDTDALDVAAVVACVLQLVEDRGLTR